MDQLFFMKRVSPQTLVRVGAAVIPVRPDGSFLLERRRDCGLWGLVGGRVEPGESVTESARRECAEETGLEVVIDHLLGVYSIPEGRLLRFEPSGDERHIVDIVMVGEVSGARVETLSAESLELRWFGPGTCPPREEFLLAAWQPVQDFINGRRSILS